MGINPEPSLQNKYSYFFIRPINDKNSSLLYIIKYFINGFLKKKTMKIRLWTFKNIYGKINYIINRPDAVIIRLDIINSKKTLLQKDWILSAENKILF